MENPNGMNDVNFNIDFGNFNPEDLQVSETINAVFVIDTSGSMADKAQEMNEALNDFVQTMQNSHIKDRLLVSQIEFDSTIEVRTGFQPITNIQSLAINPTGPATKLYDAVYVGIKKALDYRNQLENSGVTTKTLLFVITDGEDNSSHDDGSKVKKEIEKLKATEQNMFSFTAILFGIGNDSDFKAAANNMGIDLVATVGTSGKEIRKMINWISSSVTSASNGTPPPRTCHKQRDQGRRHHT